MCLFYSNVYTSHNVRKVYKWLDSRSNGQLYTPIRETPVNDDGRLLPKEAALDDSSVRARLLGGGCIHIYNRRNYDTIQQTYAAYAINVFADNGSGDAACEALWIPEACLDPVKLVRIQDTFEYLIKNRMSITDIVVVADTGQWQTVGRLLGLSEAQIRTLQKASSGKSLLRR